MDAPSTRPILPASAPKWLTAFVDEDKYIYRNVADVMPTDGTLLHDSLSGAGRVENVFFFVQRPDGDDNAAVHARLDAIKQTTESGTTLEQYYKHEGGAKSAGVVTAAGAVDNNEVASAPLPFVKIVAVFQLGDRMCGHKSLIHGGLTATLIDEVSGGTAFITVGPGVFTANLNINYTAPIPANTWVRVTSQVSKVERRKTFVDVVVDDGVGNKQFANANVLFVRPKWMPEHITNIHNANLVQPQQA